MALKQLEDSRIVDLDEERKAAMVSISLRSCYVAVKTPADHQFRSIY